MSPESTLDDYRAFLDGQELATLRDWALEVAGDRRDVAFLWRLAKHLPSTGDVERELSALDPLDATLEAIREVGHLLTHFREEAADPGLAPLLRANYIDYLLDHAGHRRFDRT